MSFGGISFAAFGTSADTTAPVLSAATGTQTGTTTANLAVMTDTAAGTMWWVVVLTAATAPNAAQVRAGTDGSSVAAVATNATGGTSAGSTSFTASATGLSAATGYKVYFTQDDLAGNHATAVGSSTFTTASSSVLIANSNAQYSSANSGCTTAGINTTGASLIVVCVAAAHGVTLTGCVTDSKSNTWTKLTTQTDSIGADTALFYTNTTASPTVGSGHTFTVTGSGFSGAMAVAAFSNAVTSPFDVEAGGVNVAAGTAQGASVSPSTDNQLIVTGLGLGGSGGSTTAAFIDLGFAIADQIGCGSFFGAAIGYLKEGTKAAKNPTWTLSGTNQRNEVCNATFKGT